MGKWQYVANVLFANWNFMRWLRLALGVYLLWQVIQRPDIFTGVVAAFFLFQAITNTGCCGADGCSVSTKERTATSKNDEVTYDEVK